VVEEIKEAKEAFEIQIEEISRESVLTQAIPY